MSQLVGEDSFDLLRFGLLNQGVEDDDVFAPGQAEEIGVTMRAALASINLVEVLEREVEFRGECLCPGTEITIFERRQLVEERLDDGWVEQDHDELEADHECHEPRNESVSGPFEYVEEGGEERRAEDDAETDGFDEVADEYARRGFVEAMFGLHDEGGVD